MNFLRQNFDEPTDANKRLSTRILRNKVSLVSAAQLQNKPFYSGLYNKRWSS